MLAGVLNDINQSKTTTISHATTTRSHRVRFNGNLVPEKLDYAKAKTFQTPTKAKKRVVEKGNVAKEIQQRTHNCTGLPFEVVDQGLGTKDQRRWCYVCGQKTKWMYVLCCFPFCVYYKETKKRK